MTRVPVPFRTEAEVRAAIPAVLERLSADALIACPTETVYGFSGAITPPAVAALRQLKRREASKPFILLVDSAERVSGVRWTAEARRLAELFWPGPLTLVLDAVPGSFARGVVGDDGGVAIRATPHPGLRLLLAAWSQPLTSTSANAPGVKPAVDAGEVVAALLEVGGSDVLVLDGGRLPPSPPSTVVRCGKAGRVRVLREGAIDVETLRTRSGGTDIDVE